MQFVAMRGSDAFGRGRGAEKQIPRCARNDRLISRDVGAVRGARRQPPAAASETSLGVSGSGKTSQWRGDHFAAVIESTLIVLVLLSSVPVTLTFCPANFFGVCWSLRV